MWAERFGTLRVPQATLIRRSFKRPSVKGCPRCSEMARSTAPLGYALLEFASESYREDLGECDAEFDFQPDRVAPREAKSLRPPGSFLTAPPEQPSLLDQWEE